MTTVTMAPTTFAELKPRGSKARWAIADTLTVTHRNLIAYTRIPEALFFSSIQPIMFVLLFTYVFGGAIRIQAGVHYIQYLMPGIFVQTVMFGAVSTTIGLAEDLHKGLIERFRALPMASSAVLGGRTTADLTRNVGVVVLITAVGYAVGFRVTTNAGEFILGALIILLFAYTLSWGFAIIGLSAPNAEAAQVMAFPLLFPFIFASAAFVPVQSMPHWLRGFATHQPVSVTIQAARSLMVGAPFHSSTAVWESLAWSAGLLCVFVPLSVWKFRRATA
jgi:ABC transporter DrrB family efflux protein